MNHPPALSSLIYRKQLCFVLPDSQHFREHFSLNPSIHPTTVCESKANFSFEWFRKLHCTSTIHLMNVLLLEKSRQIVICFPLKLNCDRMTYLEFYKHPLPFPKHYKLTKVTIELLWSSIIEITKLPNFNVLLNNQTFTDVPCFEDNLASSIEDYI